MNIEKQVEGTVVVLAVKGDVDLYSSPSLREAVLKAVSRTEHAVVINLAQVTYMDSSGVATLVEGLRATRERGMRFSLVSPSQSVLKVLQLARLDTIFAIEESAL